MCPTLRTIFQNRDERGGFLIVFWQGNDGLTRPRLRLHSHGSLDVLPISSYIQVQYFDKLHLFRICARLFSFVLEAIVSWDLLWRGDRLSFYLFPYKNTVIKTIFKFLVNVQFRPRYCVLNSSVRFFLKQGKTKWSPHNRFSSHCWIAFDVPGEQHLKQFYVDVKYLVIFKSGDLKFKIRI